MRAVDGEGHPAAMPGDQDLAERRATTCDWFNQGQPVQHAELRFSQLLCPKGWLRRLMAVNEQDIGPGTGQQRRYNHAAETCTDDNDIGGLSSTFRSSFLSRSYQCPENGLGGDEAEGLVERQDGAAEWAGG
jgi:hypothetical protein